MMFRWGQVLILHSIILSMIMAGALASEQSDLYINAATEKYLQGDYTKAVDNLETLLAIEPDNARAKKFAEKIIIEASTNLNLTRNYKEAKQFLSRGRKISPQNEKIIELENITNDILTPKNIQKMETHAPQETVIPSAPELKPKPPTVVPARPQKAPAAAVALKAPEAARSQKKEVTEVQGKTSANLYFVTAAAAVLFLIPALPAFFIYSRHIKKQFAAQKEMIAKEFEQVTETLKNEIKTTKNTAFAESIKQPRMTHPAIKKEAEKLAIKRDAERLKQIVAKSPLLTEDVFMGDPGIEQARHRIAIEVLRLNETSGAAAINFLRDLRNTNDPSVRANVPMALAAVASEEAIEMLIGMTEDHDEKVKREVIKNLKNITKRIYSGELNLPEYYARKVADALEKEIEEGVWIF